MTSLDSELPSITTHIQDAIGWVTFNSPQKLNSLNEAMWLSLPAIISDLEMNSDVRIIILRGSGEKSFSAGADISEFDRVREGDAAANYNALNNAAFKSLQECKKPTIAMIHGFCLGGGFLLALSVDLRIASNKAQFSLPPAKLGLGFDVRWLSPLLKLVPPHIAKELLFTAERYSADQCFQMGMLNSVFDAEKLEAETIKLATTIGGNAPLTLENVKSAIDALARNDHHIDFAAQDELSARCYNSLDYAEGRRAFSERRPPVFTGE